MQHTIPERVVFRFHERYQFDEAAIIEAYFSMLGTEFDNDYFSHLCAPDESAKMHIVLDIRAKTMINVDTRRIPYKVFKVKKNGTFNFSELNASACDSARQRCDTLGWGTDQHYYHPEEADGDRLAQ